MSSEDSSSSGGDPDEVYPYTVPLFWIRQQHDGAVAFIILSVLFVLFRFVGMKVAASKRKAMPFGIDDGLIIASLVPFILLCVAAIVNADAYYASYQSEETEAIIAAGIKVYKATYAFSLMLPFATALPKLAILCMYRKIFNIHVTTRRIVDCLIVFMVANCIAFFVPTAMVCRPVSDFWKLDPNEPAAPKNCLKTDVLGTWISFPHIVTDVIIMILPLPILWNTQLKLAKKIGLIITFLAGSAGLVGACLRFGYYIHDTYVVHASPADMPTKAIAKLTIVSYLEPGMYLIAACLPSMRVLVRELHTTFSSGLSSFRERRRGSASKDSGRSDSEGTPLGSADKRRVVPKVDMKLTGMGNITNMQSWAVTSQHIGEGAGAAAFRAV